MNREEKFKYWIKSANNDWVTDYSNHLKDDAKSVGFIPRSLLR
jgi:hypothetical protein